MVEIVQPDADSADLKVGASTYVLAATFGSVAFPPGMPDYQQIAILEAAERERKLGGDVLIDTRADTEEERVRKERANGNDNMSLLANIVQQDQQDRERAEWARTRSTVGDVTKTGEEWAAFADRLKSDESLRRRIIEAFEARGMSEEEAEQRYERVADMAAIAAKPPSQRTEEETERFEKAKADLTLQQDMQQASDFASQKLGATVSVSATSETPTMSRPEPTVQPEAKVAVVSGPAF